MDKLNFSDLYKFLVSVGITMILIGLLFPFLVTLDSRTIAIEKNALEQINENGKKILELKLNHVTWLMTYWKLISSITVLLGVLFTSIGLWKWLERQKKRDAKFDLDLIISEQYSISESAKSQTLDEEAAQIEDFDSNIIIDRKDFIQKSKIVENIIFTKLSTYYTSNYIPQFNVEFKASQFDIILMSKQNEKRGDVIVEVKFLKGFAIESIQSDLRKLINHISRYKSETARNVTVVIIYITDNETWKSQFKNNKSRFQDYCLKMGTKVRVKIFDFINLEDIETTVLISDE